MLANSEDDLFARKDDFYTLFNLVYESSLLGLHCCIAPIRFPVLFIFYVWKVITNISFILWTDFKQINALMRNMFTLTGLVLVNIKIFFLTTRRADDEFEEILVVYGNIKKILKYFHFLPLPEQENIVAHLVLKKFPDLLWDNILPYPHIFFEESIIDATASEGNVVAVQSVFEDTVKEISSTSTSNQTKDLHFAIYSNNDTSVVQINNEAPDGGRDRSSKSSYVNNEKARAANTVSPCHVNNETAGGDQVSKSNRINNEKSGEGGNKAGCSDQSDAHINNEKQGEDDGPNNSTSETHKAGGSNLDNSASYVSYEAARDTFNVDSTEKINNKLKSPEYK